MSSNEVIKFEEEKDFDFGETLAFRILDSSEEFKKKYSSPYDAYISPKQFINIIKTKIIELKSD
jgi:hypothetical protein